MYRVVALFAFVVLAGCSSTASPGTFAPTAVASGSPSVAPTSAPSPSLPAVTPTATPDVTEAPAPTDPPSDPGSTSPPVFGSVTLTTTGSGFANSDIGGCGAIWNGAAVYGTDDCGPHAFRLDAEPVVVAPGGQMTFNAPAGYLFSIDQIVADPAAAGFHSWAVTIAPTDRLKDLPPGQQEGLTSTNGGRVLGYGDRAVVSAWVKAPTVRGEYLVQLDASVNRGPWTWTWPRFFWRVSVR